MPDHCICVSIWVVEMNTMLKIRLYVNTNINMFPSENKVYYAILCYAMLCYVMLCCVMFCYGMVWYDMLCYGMVWYVIVCYAMLCYAMLCYAMLCYTMVWYGILCHWLLYVDFIFRLATISYVNSTITTLQWCPRRYFFTILIHGYRTWR